jgi:hypothetical protein
MCARARDTRDTHTEDKAESARHTGAGQVLGVRLRLSRPGLTSDRRPSAQATEQSALTSRRLMSSLQAPVSCSINSRSSCWWEYLSESGRVPRSKARQPLVNRVKAAVPRKTHCSLVRALAQGVSVRQAGRQSRQLAAAAIQSYTDAHHAPPVISVLGSSSASM